MPHVCAGNEHILSSSTNGRVLKVMPVGTRHGIGIFSPGNLVTAIATDLQLFILLSLTLSLFYSINKPDQPSTRNVFLSIFAGFAVAEGFLLSFSSSSILTPPGPGFWITE